MVMHFLVAVEMDIPGEVLVRLVEVDLLLEQQRVRAEIDELAALQQTLDDLRHFLMQQRLAAGDGHNRRTAFIGRLHALVERQALIEDRRRIVDLAASVAGQVAAEQRLQHQHQRVTLAPGKVLLDDIGANADGLIEWNTHKWSAPIG